MPLDKTDVENIAHLARIAVTDDELTSMPSALSNILTLVDQMNSVDIEGVEPMSHPLHMTQRLREDVISESNQREHFQSVAPMTEGGLYQVPKVIE